VIHDRWAAELPAGAGPETFAALPPRVAMGVADISRRRGMLLQRRGSAEAAEAWLRRAIVAGASVDDRAAAGEDVWAEAKYAQAYATYAVNRTDTAAMLRAIALATDVAEQTPDQPIAPDAIALATRLAEALHRQNPRAPDVVHAYRRATSVLFGSERFDRTAAFDDRLVYFAFVRFQSRGDYEPAIAWYDRQPRDHPNFLAAQAQKLACLSALLRRTADETQADQLASDLLDTRRRVTPEAQQALSSTDQEARHAAAVRVLTEAALGEAEVRTRRGQTDEALSVLDDARQTLGDRPAALRQLLQRRILLLVEADRLDEAQQTAGQLMGRFPDSAAPVIDRVVSDLGQRIQSMPAGDPTAARLAGAAAAMGKLLADWAAGQDLTEDQLLPYRLVVLRSLRLAGRPDEALAYLRDTGMDRRFRNNVEVLYEKARALMGRGDAESLRAAVPLLNRIVAGLAEPYPDVYWRAWTARLEVTAALGQDPAGLARKVRQLRQNHPDLGGEPHRTRLEQLEKTATDAAP
jgi:tetratricopeptide (TPR) repeat protein